MLAAAPLALAGDEETGGYLGVYLQDVGPSLAKALQMGEESGVLIQDVIEDSPAEEAGLQDGDVILLFDGKPVDDQKDLTKAIRKAAPGDKVEVVVLREGKKKTLDVELGEAEDRDWHWSVGELEDLHLDLQGLKDLKHNFKTWTTRDGDKFIVMGDGDSPLNARRGHLGIHIQDLNEQLGEFFKVEQGEGALVAEVLQDGAAAAAGLKAGDVIVELEGQDIEDTGDLHKALAKTEPGDEVSLRIVREGKTEDFKVTLGEAPEREITRTITIHGDDDEDIDIRAPRMIMRHGKRGFDLEDEEIMDIYRSHGHAESEMQELREELEELRGQLKELREELQR